jgi:hypothetical protein
VMTARIEQLEQALRGSDTDVPPTPGKDGG